MLTKHQLKTLVIRIALVVAIATTSASMMSAVSPADQARACNTSGHSGGGC